MAAVTPAVPLAEPACTPALSLAGLEQAAAAMASAATAAAVVDMRMVVGPSLMS